MLVEKTFLSGQTRHEVLFLNILIHFHTSPLIEMFVKMSHNVPVVCDVTTRTTVKGGHVPLAGAWVKVPIFLSRPAVRREHQPKSEGASATERGRAPKGREAHTNLLYEVF